MTISPAPRHDLTQLLTELMVFIPYESESATITITNAAGIVTYTNGATGAEIGTVNELPVRGGSLDQQLEAFLAARYPNFTHCDCGIHPPWLQGTVRKVDFQVITGTGYSKKSVRIQCHALWPREMTPAVMRFTKRIAEATAIKFVKVSDGLGMQIDVPCEIFVGQNIELAFQELIAARKDLKRFYKTKGQEQ